jgi:ABC-type multidrug transport system permease subunit
VIPDRLASVTAQRELGVLKRRRATPVPAGAVIAGRVLTAVVIAAVMAAVLLGIGWAAYGAHVPGRTALALAVTVVTGAASFCCLGYALTSLIRHEDATLPGAMALMLPLYFISGVFAAVTARRTGWRTRERSSQCATWPKRCLSPTTRTPPGWDSPTRTC